MKITGTRSEVEIDFENGYVIKGKGEFLVGNRFAVYSDSLKKWMPPHDDETLSREQINEIIRQAEEETKNSCMKLVFD